MRFGRSSKLVALGLTAVLVTMVACSSGGSDGSAGGTTNGGGTKSPAKSTTITIGAPSGPTSLDPYKCGNGPEQNFLLSGYDTLIRSAPDGTFQPSLALSWKYTSPTVFTLKLRTGVTFDDGTPLNATVVVANITRASKTLAQITAPLALNMKSVKADGPSDVTIMLNAPDPDLTTILSSCAGMIVSPKLLAHPDQMVDAMDGSGPYTYDKANSIAGSSYTFKKRATYWNSKAYPFQKAVFKVITDFNTEFNAIRSGDLDFAVGTPGEASAAKAAGLDSVQGDINFYAVDLRDREGTMVPALKDRRVRQALNMAIDRAAIIKNLFGSEGRATDQMLSVHADGYDASLNDSYPYDVKKAKKLLADAGYPNGFTLPVLSTQAFQLDQILQAMSGYWSAIGVKVKDNVQQVGAWENLLIQKQDPAVMFPFAGQPPYTAMNQSFGASSPLNPFHTDNVALDSSLKTAAVGGSATTAALTEAQKTLLDQAWYAGVGFDSVIWFFNPKVVTGIKMQQSQSVPHFYDWKQGP